MLTKRMEKLIKENTIGLVATITPDGYPAVSPKATTVVLDSTHLAFIDLRSPKTKRNIKANPSVELNYIDVFDARPAGLKGRPLILIKLIKKTGGIVYFLMIKKWQR